MRRGEVISVGPALDCGWTVVGLWLDCGWTVIILWLDGGWTMLALLETIECVGKTVMTRAWVRVSEGREVEGAGEDRGTEVWGRGLMAAERSASRGEGEAMGWTRVRLSSGMLWSWCLFQHGWQMRLLMETSTVEASSSVNEWVEGSG